jgi:hypothetical protein
MYARGNMQASTPQGATGQGYKGSQPQSPRGGTPHVGQTGAAAIAGLIGTIAYASSSVAGMLQKDRITKYIANRPKDIDVPWLDSYLKNMR